MNRYILNIAFLLVMSLISSAQVWAQKAERDNIRKGNKSYRDSAYVDAEVSYRKALDTNPRSSTALYNLGNALLFQNKAQDAMKEYELASKLENDKTKQAKIYHNAGVILQSAQEYQQAIEAYKESLRRNPSDDETRYNLALCQKMLKDSQQDSQNQNQDNEQQQQQQQQQQDQQNEQDNDEQQQEQQQEQNKMSQENAEQLLRSVVQDEKDIQDRVKKKQVMQGNHLQKDW